MLFSSSNIKTLSEFCFAVATRRWPTARAVWCGGEQRLAVELAKSDGEPCTVCSYLIITDWTCKSIDSWKFRFEFEGPRKRLNPWYPCLEIVGSHNGFFWSVDLIYIVWYHSFFILVKIALCMHAYNTYMKWWWMISHHEQGPTLYSVDWIRLPSSFFSIHQLMVIIRLT